MIASGNVVPIRPGIGIGEPDLGTPYTTTPVITETRWQTRTIGSYSIDANKLRNLAGNYIGTVTRRVVTRIRCVVQNRAISDQSYRAAVEAAVRQLYGASRVYAESSQEAGQLREAIARRAAQILVSGILNNAEPRKVYNPFTRQWHTNTAWQNLRCDAGSK